MCDIGFASSFDDGTSGFQPFSSRGTRKLMTKILWHTRKYLSQSDKKIAVISIHSHQTANVVYWPRPFFKFGIREKRSVPPTEQSGTAGFKSPCGHEVKIAGLDTSWLYDESYNILCRLI